MTANRGDYDAIPWHEEEALDTLVAELDAIDATILMAYGRYMDHPSSRRRDEISEGVVNLFDHFAHVLRSVVHGNAAFQTPESKARTIATILHGINKKHSELLVEYTDVIELPRRQKLKKPMKFYVSYCRMRQKSQTPPSLTKCLDNSVWFVIRM